MSKYETMFVIKPDLPEEQYDAVIERFKGIIEGEQGEVTNINRMGRRRLAYEVKKYREGYYVVFNFTGAPGITQELERNFRISDDVIRYLIIKEDE